MSKTDDFDAVFDDVEETSAGDIYKWETEGQILVGQLIESSIIKTPKGDATSYKMATSGGGMVSFFGSSDLKRKLDRLVEKRPVVRIEYVSKTKTNGGNDFKIFSVKAKTATQEVLKSLKINDDGIETADIGDF